MLPTCALKLPIRTRDSDEVAFLMQPQLSPERLRTVIPCLVRTPARYTEIAPAASALEDKPFLPVVPSQRHSQPCWGSQVSQHQLEPTLLHLHRSRKFSTHRSTRHFQNPGALLMKFPQYQGDAAGLRKQAPALFLSVTKRSSSR